MPDPESPHTLILDSCLKPLSVQYLFAVQSQRQGPSACQASGQCIQLPLHVGLSVNEVEWYPVSILNLKSFPQEKKQINVIKNFTAVCNKENEVKVHGSR